MLAFWSAPWYDSTVNNYGRRRKQSWAHHRVAQRMCEKARQAAGHVDIYVEANGSVADEVRR